jgi:hypothetical protein
MADKLITVGGREFSVAFKGGTSRGRFRDGGRIAHAVPRAAPNGFDGRAALCGTRPGPKGYGWTATDFGQEVGCPRCREKLAKIAAALDKAKEQR